MKISGLIDLFIADVCAGKFNETEKGYRQKLRQLERFAKNKPITGKLIKGFMHDMKTRTHHQVGYKIVEGGLSIYTIKTTFQTTRHFCKWLFQNGYITEDISPLIKIPNPPPPTPKAVSEDTVIRLIKSALNNVCEEWERARDVAIIYYLRDTGRRRRRDYAGVTLSGPVTRAQSQYNVTDQAFATIDQSRAVSVRGCLLGAGPPYTIHHTPYSHAVSVRWCLHH